MTSATMLYRHFDAKRRLLYVGISVDALKRAEAHGQKPWGHLIVKITVEHFATRAEAEAAEKAAIMAEAPRFNVVYLAQRWLPTKSGAPKAEHAPVELELDLTKHMADLQRGILIRALRVYHGNRTLAGRRLGLNLRQMRYRMARLGVTTESALS